MAHANFPCNCIANTKLSSLNPVFHNFCKYFDHQQGWRKLAPLLQQLNVIDQLDTEAVIKASSFQQSSPSMELFLRIEGRFGPNFLVANVLKNLYHADMIADFNYLLHLTCGQHTNECDSGISNQHHWRNFDTPSMDGFLCSGQALLVQSPGLEFAGIGSGPPFQVGFQPGMKPNHALPEYSGCVQSPKNQNTPSLHISENPKDKDLQVGEDLLLRCIVKCSEHQSEIRYQWFKDDKLLEESDGILLIKGGVCLSDSGQYRCEVWLESFGLKVSSRPANITVINGKTDLGKDDSGSEKLSSIANDSTTVEKSDKCDTLFEKNSKKVHHKYPRATAMESATNSQNEQQSTQYTATDKLALLIGNERYVYNPELTSASNDVKALAEVLEHDLHFKTISLVNLNLKEMKAALKLFCSCLCDGAYCLTYLAGHGFENDGQCYIVPFDAPVNYCSSDCFSVKKMIQEITSTCDVRLNVVLLDVCRKRNKDAGIVTEPSVMKGMNGNFVISFATMESGMAYEVRGQHLSVYAKSLLRHLKKQKRITRVLELVHQDIHKDLKTQGAQQPEFKSNLFEDRKLTDPIQWPCQRDQEKKNKEWTDVFEQNLPILFVFESHEVKVELGIENSFTNVVSLKPKVIDKGDTERCKVSLTVLAQDGSHTTTCLSDADDLVERSSLVLKDVQRLSANEIQVVVMVEYSIQDEVFRGSVKERIAFPFLLQWKKFYLS